MRDDENEKKTLSYGFRKKSKIINIFDFLPPQAVFRTISLYLVMYVGLWQGGARGKLLILRFLEYVDWGGITPKILSLGNRNFLKSCKF